MKVSGFLSSAILLVLPSIAAAAPATNTLHRRDCPSVETIETWIKDNKHTVGENTVFYTAGAGSEQAQRFANTLDEGNYWGSVWSRPNELPIWFEWLEQCGVGEPQNALYPLMGEALARRSSGTAYVLMVEGKDLRAFWFDNEYPYLKDRVKVIAVNAEDLAARCALRVVTNEWSSRRLTDEKQHLT